MIQFKRGTTESWKKLKTPLAAGQPGYDKDKHKIKVGDGTSLWEKLPYASISEEEVLDSEENAKKRKQTDPESLAIITYGEESPDKDTIGQLYLQCYDSDPEVDYVVEFAMDGIWSYRKWHSGLAECWGVLEVTTDIKTKYEELFLYYNSSSIKSTQYPFTFKGTPSELASLQSPAGIVWLASNSKNSNKATATYSLISPDQLTSATYSITFNVRGYWK